MLFFVCTYSPAFVDAFSFFVWFYVCSNFNFATCFFVFEAEIVHLLL